MTILLAVPAHAYQKPAGFDTTVQGGVLFINSEVDATVNKVGKFSYNKANRGGVFYAMGGTMRFPNTVKFTGNMATNGGGVFFVGGRIDFTGAAEFDGNKGGGEGGMALNYVAADSNALYFATEPMMTANTGGTYNQTHKHCYVGSEKRPNCCPSGTEFNTATGVCEVPITCTGGQVAENGQCVCPPATPNWTGTKCISCPKEFVFRTDWMNGCSCPLGTGWDVIQKKCVPMCSTTGNIVLNYTTKEIEYGGDRNADNRFGVQIAVGQINPSTGCCTCTTKNIYYLPGKGYRTCKNSIWQGILWSLEEYCPGCNAGSVHVFQSYSKSKCTTSPIKP